MRKKKLSARKVSELKKKAFFTRQRKNGVRGTKKLGKLWTKEKKRIRKWKETFQGMGRIKTRDKKDIIKGFRKVKTRKKSGKIAVKRVYTPKKIPRSPVTGWDYKFSRGKKDVFILEVPAGGVMFSKGTRTYEGNLSPVIDRVINSVDRGFKKYSIRIRGRYIIGKKVKVVTSGIIGRLDYEYFNEYIQSMISSAVKLSLNKGQGGRYQGSFYIDEIIVLGWTE